jgi:methyl-accepting chemotaxis protein
MKKELLFTIVGIAGLGFIVLAAAVNQLGPQSLFVHHASWTLVLALIFIIQYSVIAVPLRQINHSLRQVLSGDLTKKLYVPTGKLFAALVQNINLFILKIRQFINETTIMTDKVIQYCQDIVTSAQVIEQSANENCKAINSVSENMTEQVQGISKAKTLIQQVVNEHKKVVTEGQGIEALSASMNVTIDETNTIYEELTAKMQQSATVNLTLAAKTQTLYEQAFKIQGIVDTVKAISYNTKILSLNAAIEAARAGEAGKGFSVVANEIRRLAEVSSAQAMEIQHIIATIKDDISEIASGMKKEVETIQANIRFASVTKDNLHKIAVESQNTLKSIQHINVTIEAQDEQVASINRFTEEVARMSESTTAATQQIAAASEQQVSVMQKMFLSVENLTGMNETLKNRIASFANQFELNAEVRRKIKQGFEILREMAGSEGLASMEYNRCTTILKNNIAKYTQFELFGLVQKDGLRKAITLDYREEEVYANFAHRPYFQAAIKGNEYQSEPYISVDTNNYCIAIAVPVKDSQGEITGIVMGDLILG